MSAMRKSARTPAAGGGLVEVDDRTVFARCFPKSWINVVRIYETATSPPGSLVGSYPLLVSSVLSAKRKSASVRGRRGGHAGHRLCTNRRRCCVSPGRFCVGGGVVLIRTIRGCTPIVGGGWGCPQCGHPQAAGSRRWYTKRHPPHKRLCGGCLCVKLLGRR